MKNTFTFPSKDQKTNIHVTEWRPEGQPRAVLQLIHGMVEYIDRYDRFANYCTEHGFLVLGHDHLGHGRSVVNEDKHGYFAENGLECLLEDIHTLQVMSQARYPDLPYFILGHSMGSFLLRIYLASHGDRVNGALILGTGQFPTAILESAKTMMKSMANVKGWDYHSPLLKDAIFGTVNRKFKPTRTPNDWLSKDTKAVDAYSKHPWTTFSFSLNGYNTLFEAIEEAQKQTSSIPRDCPILLASGKEDPVGQSGLGVKRVYDSLLDAGLFDVELKLYENDRHELLQETNAHQVYRDLLRWMDKHMPNN